MKKIAVLFLAVMLFGCVSGSEEVLTNSPNKVAYVENDNVSTQLAIAAKKASNAMVELAEIEKMRNPMNRVSSLDNIPELLKQPISITWNGPLNSILKTLADRSLYRYVEIGAKSSTPILVQVDAIEEPIINILKNVGMQAGSRANVVVDIENRNIEVHYANIR